MQLETFGAAEPLDQSVRDRRHVLSGRAASNIVMCTPRAGRLRRNSSVLIVLSRRVLHRYRRAINSWSSEGRPRIPLKPPSPPSTLAATAYWLLSESGIRNFFTYIEGGGDRDAMGNFLSWNVKLNRVLSVSFKGSWFDIGSLESYSEAQSWLEIRP